MSVTAFLTADQVRDLLDYEPATGNLKWRKFRLLQRLQGAAA